jgi:hypothetical protein
LIRKPPLVHQDGHLSRPDDELRAVLDLIVVAGKAPDQSLPVVLGPFDDVDQLRAQLLQESHGTFSLLKELSQ